MHCIAFTLRPGDIATTLRGWVRPPPDLEKPREVPTPWGGVYLTRRPIPIDPVAAEPFEPTEVIGTDVSGFGGDCAFALGRVLGLYSADEYPEVLDIWGGPEDGGWIIFDIPHKYVAAVNEFAAATPDLVEAWARLVAGTGLDPEYLEQLWILLRDLCEQAEVKSGEATLFIAELIQ